MRLLVRIRTRKPCLGLRATNSAPRAFYRNPSGREADGWHRAQDIFHERDAVLLVDSQLQGLWCYGYHAGHLSLLQNPAQANCLRPLSLTTPIPAPGGNVPGNVVEVSVQNYPLNWLVPISGTIASPFRSNAPATLSIYSDDVMGGYPAGVNTVAR